MIIFVLDSDVYIDIVIDVDSVVSHWVWQYCDLVPDDELELSILIDICQTIGVPRACNRAVVCSLYSSLIDWDSPHTAPNVWGAGTVYGHCSIREGSEIVLMSESYVNIHSCIDVHSVICDKVGHDLYAVPYLVHRLAILVLYGYSVSTFRVIDWVIGDTLCHRFGVSEVPDAIETTVHRGNSIHVNTATAVRNKRAIILVA